MQRPSAPRRRRRLDTVLGRLVVAAAQIVVPIFALAVIGFLQLDSHTQRFSGVATKAAWDMRLVDGLSRDFELADGAVDAYLETGDRASLETANRVKASMEANLARARDSDRAEGRGLGEAATRRWVSIVSRLDRAEDSWSAGRRPPASFEVENELDVTAGETLVVRLLESSRRQIEDEVARGREKRARDLWLLALQIGCGILLATWAIRRVARQTVGPLTRLSAAADRLRAGHHSERVRVDGPVELARMGSAFNVMADTLEGQQGDLRRLAYLDALTGLPNRVAFVEQLEAVTAGDGSAAVLYLDLDDFKSVNDALGHTCGDALLVEVARRVREVVGSAGTVARLGGDEFAVLLAGPEADDTAARALAERLLEALVVPTTIEGLELVPTGSLGIATGTESAEGLLRDADVAMYKAKRDGRHGHATFEPSMQAAAGRRLAGIADLRHALEAGQFRVVYQPIVDLATRTVRATEALVRWEHPERGVVSPAEFIPLAEQTGLIVQIGEWVLREACRQSVAWHREHPDDGRVMTVNLSTRQLLEAELVDVVRSALADSGLPPGRLMLEITESAVMADPAGAIARLAELRRLGVRIAVDDFGTGHSSLAYLRDLPVDELKIAREFVSVMEESAHDLALARGILALGQGLGLRVIAEGIETEAEHHRLLGMGCDSGQGYLYARPLPAREVVPLLVAARTEEPETAWVATATPAVALSARAPAVPLA